MFSLLLAGHIIFTSIDAPKIAYFRHSAKAWLCRAAMRNDKPVFLSRQFRAELRQILQIGRQYLCRDVGIFGGDGFIGMMA